MKTTMLGFLAETAIHCGAGRSAGIIDLPIAREAATDYPFIPGSSLKGALRDRAQALGRKDEAVLFGQPDRAGKILISDARLALLPVRCLTGAYRWVTCPLLLERYQRDLRRCGLPAELPQVSVSGGKGAAGALAFGSGTLYLEEREFAITGECPAKVHELIGFLIRHEETRRRLREQVVVVGNEDFAWFCRYAVPIQARNVLKKDGSKRSENLWYEESLAQDTVLYAMAMARDEESQKAILEMFPESDPYLQIGGNETVGHGWVAVSLHRGGGAR